MITQGEYKHVGRRAWIGGPWKQEESECNQTKQRSPLSTGYFKCLCQAFVKGNWQLALECAHPLETAVLS